MSTNDETNLKTVLEKALQSPDPAVRNAAIERERMSREIELIDTFLVNYGRWSASITLVPAPLKKVNLGGRPKGSKNSQTKPDAFVVRVKTLMKSHGKPVALPELHAAYEAAYPDQDRVDQETFRQFLYRRRRQNVFTYENGLYWLPSEESALAS